MLGVKFLIWFKVEILLSANSVFVFHNGIIEKIGIKTIGLSGRTGGAMNELCELNLVVPSNDTPRIQEMHIMIGHIICQAIDDAF